MNSHPTDEYDFEHYEPESSDDMYNSISTTLTAHKYVIIDKILDHPVYWEYNDKHY